MENNINSKKFGEKRLFEMLKISDEENPQEESSPPSNKKLKTSSAMITDKDNDNLFFVVGSSDFIDLREKSSYIVDKSLFIKKFVNSKPKHNVVLYPRRFGKSTNLTMIKTFLEIETDNNCEKMPKEQRKNPKYFLGEEEFSFSSRNNELFPLNIASEKEFIEDNLGQWPVIYINFRVGEGSTSEEIIELIKLKIATLFRKFNYLLKSEKLSPLEKEIFNQFVDYRINHNLGTGSFSDSLKFLSECLFTIFGQKVFVIIDEYDAPINNAFEALKTFEDVKKVIRFYSSLMTELLKDNTYVEKSLITGILHINQIGIFSGLNCVTEFTISDPGITSGFYGFTQEEVNYLYTNYKVPESVLINVKKWYNGYNVDGIEIYNTWSIISCLAKVTDFVHSFKFDESEITEKCIQNYWEKSGNMELFLPLLSYQKIREEIYKLINGESVYFTDLKIVSKTYWELVQTCRNACETLNVIGDVFNMKMYFLNILLYAGYLTILKNGKNFVKIPNKEIKVEMISRFADFYSRLGDNFQETILLLHNIFCNEKENTQFKIEKFAQSFEKYLKSIKIFINIKSDNEEGVHANESICVSILNVIALQVKNLKMGTEIWINGQKGRPDIVMIHSNGTGIIIEVKFDKCAVTAIGDSIKKEYSNLFSECKGNIKLKKQIQIGLNIDKTKAVTFKFKEE